MFGVDEMVKTAMLGKFQKEVNFVFDLWKLEIVKNGFIV